MPWTQLNVKTKLIHIAVNTLRDYAQDDEQDAMRLKPIIRAFDQGDLPAFYRLCRETLATYRAADIFIDELYEYACSTGCQPTSFVKSLGTPLQ